MFLNNNQHIRYNLIDRLLDKNVCFALYKLPNENIIKLVLQTSGKTYSLKHFLDISNTTKGFIISPFHINEEQPILIIQPEIVLEGEEGIFTYLEKYTEKLQDKTNKLTCIPMQENAKNDSIEVYKDKFEKFHQALDKGIIEKIVLSRRLVQPLDNNQSIGSAFKKATEMYPNNFVYLCHTSISGTWLGCSPEILISGQDNNWNTVALAGTKKTTDNKWDEKNRKEQQFVVTYMEQQLTKANCPFTKSQLMSARSGEIEHLKTNFNFSLPQSTSIGRLLDLLHPSPAVCGYPKNESLEFILKNERYNRKYYTGFVGYLDTDNVTNLYVNLRCMEVREKSLLLYAGGGLLPSSELETEWQETINKLQTILSVME